MECRFYRRTRNRIILRKSELRPSTILEHIAVTRCIVAPTCNFTLPVDRLERSLGQSQGMRKRNLLPAVLLSAGLGFGGAYVVLAPDDAWALARSAVGQFGLAGCDIKGNVSIDGGERIYHVPGQRHYSETRIRHEFGERYFCTEHEARAAGWRRSRY